MKIIAQYECEVCKTKYKTMEDAIQCETLCQKEIDYKAKNKTRLSHSFSIIGERDNIKA